MRNAVVLDIYDVQRMLFEYLRQKGQIGNKITARWHTDGPLDTTTLTLIEEE